MRRGDEEKDVGIEMPMTRKDGWPQRAAWRWSMVGVPRYNRIGSRLFWYLEVLGAGG